MKYDGHPSRAEDHALACSIAARGLVWTFDLRPRPANEVGGVRSPTDDAPPDHTRPWSRRQRSSDGLPFQAMYGLRSGVRRAVSLASLLLAIQACAEPDSVVVPLLDSAEADATGETADSGAGMEHCSTEGIQCFCSEQCNGRSTCANEHRFMSNIHHVVSFDVCDDFETDFEVCVAQLDSCRPLGDGCEETFTAMMRCRASWLEHDSNVLLYGECRGQSAGDPYFLIHTAGTALYHVTCDGAGCGCATSPDGPDWTPIDIGIGHTQLDHCWFAADYYDYIVAACTGQPLPWWL